MEENVSISTSVDYSEYFNQLIDLQISINDNLESISNDVKFLRDYFEITEEEQKILDEENLKKIEQDKLEKEKLYKIQKEKEDSFVRYIEDTFPQYTEQFENITSELQKVNENLTSNIEVGQYGVNQNYVFAIGFGFSMIILLLYKMLKKFFY